MLHQTGLIGGPQGMFKIKMTAEEVRKRRLSVKITAWDRAKEFVHDLYEDGKVMFCKACQHCVNYLRRQDNWSIPNPLATATETQVLLFTRDCETANSSYRMDYTPHVSYRPDVVTFQRTRSSEGLPLRQLFSHHDVPSSHCLVSLYDESYGRQASSSLPALHSWSSFKLARVPERSDHPIQGPPTNFGLVASWRARMEQQRAVVPTLSEYKASYPLHPISTFCYSRHVSMPKRFSSSQHPANLSTCTGRAWH